MIAIVKVQVPIATNDPNRPALVYAKGRKYMVQQKLDGRVDAVMKQTPKAFFEAEFNNGVWKIGKQVPDQNW